MCLYSVQELVCLLNERLVDVNVFVHSTGVGVFVD